MTRTCRAAAVRPVWSGRWSSAAPTWRTETKLSSSEILLVPVVGHRQLFTPDHFLSHSVKPPFINKPLINLPASLELTSHWIPVCLSTGRSCYKSPYLIVHSSLWRKTNRLCHWPYFLPLQLVPLGFTTAKLLIHRFIWYRFLCCMPQCSPPHVASGHADVLKWGFE